MTSTSSFEPDWICAPGETIKDILMERAIPDSDFAELMGMPLSQAHCLLAGETPITQHTAERLATFLGSTVKFWMKRECLYRNRRATRKEVHSALNYQTWLKALPVKEMIKFGWLSEGTDKENLIEGCLDFFGIADLVSWEQDFLPLLSLVPFRKSGAFESKLGPTAAWLRRGEVVGESRRCKRWDKQKFIDALPEVKKLTRIKDLDRFAPVLEKICAECGVVTAIIPPPSGCTASGAARFLSSGTALLMLSLRYKTDDHFWFTFFHEAGHLILHERAASSGFVVDFDEFENDTVESEANEFAEQMLVPQEFTSELQRLGANSRTIIRFAQKVGVSPGIIVGQLQHKNLLSHRQLNSLKRRFSWD